MEPVMMQTQSTGELADRIIEMLEDRGIKLIDPNLSLLGNCVFMADKGIIPGAGELIMPWYIYHLDNGNKLVDVSWRKYISYDYRVSQLLKEPSHPRTSLVVEFDVGGWVSYSHIQKLTTGLTYDHFARQAIQSKLEHGHTVKRITSIIFDDDCSRVDEVFNPTTGKFELNPMINDDIDGLRDNPFKVMMDRKQEVAMTYVNKGKIMTTENTDVEGFNKLVKGFLAKLESLGIVYTEYTVEQLFNMTLKSFEQFTKELECKFTPWYIYHLNSNDELVNLTWREKTSYQDRLVLLKERPYAPVTELHVGFEGGEVLHYYRSGDKYEGDHTYWQNIVRGINLRTQEGRRVNMIDTRGGAGLCQNMVETLDDTGEFFEAKIFSDSVHCLNFEYPFKNSLMESLKNV